MYHGTKPFASLARLLALHPYSAERGLNQIAAYREARRSGNWSTAYQQTIVAEVSDREPDLDGSEIAAVTGVPLCVVLQVQDKRRAAQCKRQTITIENFRNELQKLDREYIPNTQIKVAAE